MIKLDMIQIVDF